MYVCTMYVCMYVCTCMYAMLGNFVAQSCLHTFPVLISLHVLSLFKLNVFIILVSFFNNCSTNHSPCGNSLLYVQYVPFQLKLRGI